MPLNIKINEHRSIKVSLVTAGTSMCFEFVDGQERATFQAFDGDGVSTDEPVIDLQFTVEELATLRNGIDKIIGAMKPKPVTREMKAGRSLVKLKKDINPVDFLGLPR